MIKFFCLKIKRKNPDVSNQSSSTSCLKVLSYRLSVKSLVQCELGPESVQNSLTLIFKYNADTSETKVLSLTTFCMVTNCIVEAECYLPLMLNPPL